MSLWVLSHTWFSVNVTSHIASLVAMAVMMWQCIRHQEGMHSWPTQVRWHKSTYDRYICKHKQTGNWSTSDGQVNYSNIRLGRLHLITRQYICIYDNEINDVLRCIWYNTKFSAQVSVLKTSTVVLEVKSHMVTNGTNISTVKANLNTFKNNLSFYWILQQWIKTNLWHKRYFNVNKPRYWVLGVGYPRRELLHQLWYRISNSLPGWMLNHSSNGGFV